MVLQGLGDASVWPVWAEKGWSTRGPWVFLKLRGGCWLRGSGQCGVPGGVGRLVRRFLCDPQLTRSANSMRFTRLSLVFIVR